MLGEMQRAERLHRRARDGEHDQRDVGAEQPGVARDGAEAVEQGNVLVLGRADLGLERGDGAEHEDERRRARPSRPSVRRSARAGRRRAAPRWRPMGSPVLIMAAVRPRRSGGTLPSAQASAADQETALKTPAAKRRLTSSAKRADERVQRRRDREQQRGGDRHAPRPEAVGEVPRRHGGEQHGRAVGADDDARLRLAEVQRVLPARQQRRHREPEHEVEEDERGRRAP